MIFIPNFKMKTALDIFLDGGAGHLRSLWADVLQTRRPCAAHATVECSKTMTVPRRSAPSHLTGTPPKRGALLQVSKPGDEVLVSETSAAEHVRSQLGVELQGVLVHAEELVQVQAEGDGLGGGLVHFGIPSLGRFFWHLYLNKPGASQAWGRHLFTILTHLNSIQFWIKLTFELWNS